METRANHVLIGSFVLSAVALAFLFALWLGRLSFEQEYDFYVIRFSEPVTGLQVASDARFNGIKVGEVVDLTIDRRNPSITDATIRIEDGIPVKTDSVATLELLGITGLSYILLSGGSQEAPLLKDVSESDPPVMTAGLSELQRLLAGSGDTLASVNEALANVRLLFSPQNIRNVERILQNVADATEIVTARSDTLNQLLLDAGDAMGRLNAASGDLETIASGLGDAMQDEIPTILSDAEATLASLRVASADLSTTLGSASPHVRAFAEDGLPELTDALAEARLLLGALGRLARRIEQNPAVLLSGASTAPQYDGSEDDQ